MKHFGIFILLAVTFIQYGYGEGEEATQATEGETDNINTDGENPTEPSVVKEEEQKVEESHTEGAGSEVSETQGDTEVTEGVTIENLEQQTEAAVAESETEQSETNNLQEASEGTSVTEDVTTVESVSLSFPDNAQEAIVSTNAPVSGGEKDEPSRATKKPYYSPGLCQRPLIPRWPPTITRPCPCPYNRFTRGDFQGPLGQRPFTGDNPHDVNIPPWVACTNRPLPEPPGSILLRLRALRNNNMNPPLCAYRGGGMNRMPIVYPGSRTPPNYLRQSYTHL